MRTSAGSPTKAELARLTEVARDGLVSIEDAPGALGLSRQDAAVRLARLTTAGWLARIKRGLYYVLPVDAADSRRTTYPDPWALASRAFEPCYVGGWTAAEHWGLTEQLFKSTFVATAASLRSRQQVLLGLEFELALVQPDRMAGLRSEWRGSSRVLVSGAERTLMDGFREPAWLGGIRHALDCLRRYLEVNGGSGVVLLVQEAMTSGNAPARKRLGFLLEEAGIAGDTLAPLREGLTKGLVRLDPAMEKEGRISRRWGLLVNADLR
ncbi:MAG: type IV toxin-antitoxin system AbiEi family antitoxin domain-containing protein [Gemmatimonadaceae bacterium]